MKMDTKNNKGIACNNRLMIYRPIRASDEHKMRTRRIGQSVPYFYTFVLTICPGYVWASMASVLANIPRPARKQKQIVNHAFSRCMCRICSSRIVKNASDWIALTHTQPEATLLPTWTYLYPTSSCYDSLALTAVTPPFPDVHRLRST